LLNKACRKPVGSGAVKGSGDGDAGALTLGDFSSVLLAVVSVVVTLNLIDSPLGAPWDEIVKLRGVSTGRYHYYHPLFMIDLA
jgi:hypothetical protein